MAASETIWFSTVHLPVYRCGGWAFVRSTQGETSGVAGGVRPTTASRLRLAGLAAALGTAPSLGPSAVPAGLVDIITPGFEANSVAALLAALAALDPLALPEVDGDLWVALMKAAAGRRIRLSPLSRTASAPLTFVAAWAELASGKAKAAGPFKAAIPKANLAKVAFA